MFFVKKGDIHNERLSTQQIDSACSFSYFDSSKFNSRNLYLE